MDQAIGEIREIWSDARTKGGQGRPAWPMIVLRTPKGWTCPQEIDGKKSEDYWRSHQVPMGDMDKAGHVAILEAWMKSYRPEELFDADKLSPDIAALAPKGTRRMSANPHANGEALLEDLRMPDYRQYAVGVASPGAVNAESTREMGKFLRDVMRMNLASKNFRVFSPDENNSNRWTNHKNLHVRGYKEEGTTTTPFDMCVLNDMDRYRLVMDVIDRVPGLVDRSAGVRRAMADKRAEHKRYVAQHGEDMPETAGWAWPGRGTGAGGTPARDTAAVNG
jgi:phosphoketolase